MTIQPIKITLPPGFDEEAWTYWCENQTDKAITRLTYLLNNNPSHAIAKQSGYCAYRIGDYSLAIFACQHMLSLIPNDSNILKNLALCYLKLDQFEQFKTTAEQAFSLAPDDYSICDLLADGYSKIKLFDKAQKMGTRALNLKDQQHGTLQTTWSLPDALPKDFCRGKINVISFSLWGDNPCYLRGALRNLLLAPDIYPLWQLWFYVDESVPESFLSLIEALGGVVKMQANTCTMTEKLCWRFQVANAREVGYFLVRDCDSVFNVRERNAVYQWIDSDKWFHIIRDWWTHTDLILAGLWGGIAQVLPNISEKLMHYKPPYLETPNIDQWFLRDVIWCYVKQSCLIHDRCFQQVGSLPLAQSTAQNIDHIGADEFAQNPGYQEQRLMPWIITYPCLGKLRYTDLTSLAQSLIKKEHFNRAIELLISKGSLCESELTQLREAYYDAEQWQKCLEITQLFLSLGLKLSENQQWEQNIMVKMQQLI